jgi:hypothetical protein
MRRFAYASAFNAVAYQDIAAQAANLGILRMCKSGES